MPAKLKRAKYGPEYLKMARQLGREGFAVSEASIKMNISRAAFLQWERRIPAFRKAASKIRENSEKWKALRFAKLLERNEEQLLSALARVREKKAEELRKYQAQFGGNN